MPSSSYKLIGIFRVRPAAPGFGIPVFRDRGRLVIQQIDDSGTIAGFADCDVSEASLRAAPSEMVDARYVGEKALYCFELPSGKLLVAERMTLAATLVAVTTQLEATPFVLHDVALFLANGALAAQAKEMCDAILKGDKTSNEMGNLSVPGTAILVEQARRERNRRKAQRPTEGSLVAEEWVGQAFDALTLDLPGIYEDARLQSLSGWRERQYALVAGSSAAAAAIPGLHLVGMAAEVAFLMKRMSVCAYGIGAIEGHSHGFGNFLELEDFAVILARWGGDDRVSNAAIGNAAADLVGKVGRNAMAKMLAKVAASRAGIIAGNKLAGDVSAKVGTKFLSKLGTKAVAAWIPFLGSALGGGINLWFIAEIAEEAQSWYKCKTSAGMD